MRRLSIRWRLTLWYGAVLSAILVGFSGAVYLLMRYELLALTDASLREELLELRNEVGRARSTASLNKELRHWFASHEGYEFQVSSPAGAVLFRSEGIDPEGLPRPAPERIDAGDAIYETVGLEGIGPARLASRMVPGPGGPVLVQSAITLAPNARALRELLAVLLTAGPSALVCALAGGYWLARKALAPVDRMVVTAAEITATRLGQRLEEPAADDELGRLARTFNAMIARLQRSFDEIRRFTADAAHELRTPLATMRTAAEVALCSPRSPAQDERVLENLLEEIERLSRLVSQLLFLCREDTGLCLGDFRPIRLDELVGEVSDHMGVAAREKGVELRVELAAAGRVRGDADRLRQLFFNLLDNAIKYTPPGGTVTLRGEAPNGQARVVVADTGIGIPAEHLPRVFDRFYRVDPSRGPETEGTGLGLAICRSIAEAHGGRLEIESAMGRGTSIRLSLPALSEQIDARR